MKNTNVIERTFLFSWPYALLFSLITYIVTQNWDYVLSFLLGTFVGLLMNSMNYRVMKNLFKNNPSAIKKSQIWIYIAKFAFFGLILYFTHVSDKWNVYFTFVGLLTYRIVLVPLTLIVAHRGKGGGLDG